MDIVKNEAGRFETTLEGKDGPIHLEFQKWGAEEATDTLLDLIAVVGESAGGIISALTGGGGDVDVGHTSLEGLFRQLTLGLTRDRTLTKRVLKKLSSDRVIANGVLINWASFYKDQLPLSFAVARAQLEVQYGNFIDAGRSLGLLGPSPVTASPSSPS